MCWKCGNPVTADSPVGRSAVCEICGADLRCCRNCCFYDPSSRYECRETVEDPVRDKERGNFCDFFRLSRSGIPGSGNVCPAEEKEGRKKAFDSLFGD